MAISLLVLFTLSALAMPLLSEAAARPVVSETPPVPVEVVLEDPTTYHPPIGPCDETYWYPLVNDRGHDVYLTLNVTDPADSTNSAEWIPELPEAGYYRVEAYVTWHDPIEWCSESAPVIYTDTTDARYTITHAFGETTVSRSQTPLANEWLDLGEYYFNAGSGGNVVLTDLNGEAEFTTTVSFSAMRFTWTRMPPARNVLPMLNRNLVATPSVQPTPWVGVQADPAFDACHMGAASTLQVWWDSSPYKIVGLYLGGISYPEGCETISADWVAQVRNMGWTFMPIWSGPQAPCTSYKHQMDEDPAVTYQQGRAEADAASQKASELGLTNYGVAGTVIYYDMEAYGGIPEECRLAVDAFLNGWTERLHELGNQSGAYGSSCSSYPTRWIGLDNPPDNVWLAYWTEDEYDPDQTVYGLPCFLDSYYTDHQRVKQYAGGHDETWGGRTIEIDSDIADAEVAMPVITPTLAGGKEVERSHPGEAAIQQASWLSADHGWIISDGRLYLTLDGGESWQDDGLSGVQRASILADGTAWAAGGGMLYRRDGEGMDRQTSPLPGELSDWRVVQVGLTDASNGWLVLRKPTSTIFNIGKLLRTLDGGKSWQSYSMPFTAEITWLDTQTGWLSGGVSGRELYRTADGGRSWQEVVLPAALATVNAPVFLGQVSVSSDGTLTLSAAISQVKTPVLQTYTSRDGGKSWQLASMNDLREGAPLGALAQSGMLFADGTQLRNLSAATSFTFGAAVVQLESNGSGLVWVVSRQGTCEGEKGEANFNCYSQDSLWLSTDGGVSWRMVLP
jgi:hypothetical protein